MWFWPVFKDPVTYAILFQRGNCSIQRGNTYIIKRTCWQFHMWYHTEYLSVALEYLTVLLQCIDLYVLFNLGCIGTGKNLLDLYPTNTHFGSPLQLHTWLTFKHFKEGCCQSHTSEILYEILKSFDIFVISCDFSDFKDFVKYSKYDPVSKNGPSRHKIHLIIQWSILVLVSTRSISIV